MVSSESRNMTQRNFENMLLEAKFTEANRR
jgi:hypothetical protein